MSGNHAHGAVSAAGKHRWRLQIAFGLVALFFVVELVAGLISNSLALISDAGHMAADVVGLGAALVATAIASRPDKSGRRTFGYYRAEVFASLLCVLLMYGVSIYVIIEAIDRIGTTTEIMSGTMMIVGIGGLIINLISMWLLRAGSKESLNLKGAYLEVLADTLGSVGVVVAGILVTVTGNAVWDTVVSLAIAAFILVRATILAREVFSVLGQDSPSHLKPEEINAALEELPGVVGVHDLHLWTLTSGMDVATVHLESELSDPSKTLESAQALLHDEFDLEHATIQIENKDATTCQSADW